MSLGILDPEQGASGLSLWGQPKPSHLKHFSSPATCAAAWREKARPPGAVTEEWERGALERGLAAFRFLVLVIP